MNARIAAILVVLLIVLGGAALLYQHQESAQRPSNAGTLGQPVLKDLKVAEVAAIRIVEPRQSLTIQRKEDRWSLAERGGFPADVGKVREFMLKMIGLKVGQSEPIGEKDRARLNLEPPGKSEAAGTLLEFDGADGKPLGKLIVGKKYFKREVDNPAKANADGRFVAVPGDAATVYVVSDPLAQASARSADWIERGGFKIEKVKTLEVRYPDGGGYRIERDGDNADWKLAGARPGEKLDVSRANAASYSLGLMELADVAPKDAKDTGLDNATVISATTLEGKPHAIRVGKLQGESYYARFGNSDYIVLVPKSKLEDTLKKRSELLEQKPDSKK